MPAMGNPRQWIAKAEQDYRTVLALSRLRVAPVPDSVCFHAQQCAEKYLKALLIRERTPFPHTHDLIRLLDLLLPIHPPLTLLRPALLELKPLAVEVRYPGRSMTPSQARLARQRMDAVRSSLRKTLGLQKP